MLCLELLEPNKKVSVFWYLKYSILHLKLWIMRLPRGMDLWALQLLLLLDEMQLLLSKVVKTLIGPQASSDMASFPRGKRIHDA